MDNAEVAQLLDEVADLLEIERANPTRVKAYRDAALSVRNFSQKLSPTEVDLEFGDDMSRKLRTLLKTGELPLLNMLRRKIPLALRELMKVTGLGPRRAMLLYNELGIRSIPQLREAAEKHRIANLRGFGAKTEQNILASLQHQDQSYTALARN